MFLQQDIFYIVHTKGTYLLESPQEPLSLRKPLISLHIVGTAQKEKVGQALVFHVKGVVFMFLIVLLCVPLLC